MNYYRRFPGDYLRDTLHLTMTQDGAYTRLLDAYYSAEKPLPAERETLYAMVRANTEQDRAAVEFVLSHFFRKTRFGFTNRRAKKEFLRTKEISTKRANAAKQRTKHPANAEQMQCNPDSRLQTPYKDLKEREEHTHPAAAPLLIPAPPDWLPLSTWVAFAQMRKKLRKPLTDHASELVWRELERLKAAGHDPIERLEASIRNGWLDVYAPKKESRNGNKSESFDERRQRESQAAISEVGARARAVVSQMEGSVPDARPKQITDGDVH